MGLYFEVLRRISNGDYSRENGRESKPVSGTKGRWALVPSRTGPDGSAEVTILSLRRYVLRLVGTEEELACAQLHGRRARLSLEYWDAEGEVVQDDAPLLSFDPRPAAEPGGAVQGELPDDWRRYKGVPVASVVVRFTSDGESSPFGIRSTCHQHDDRFFRLRARWLDTGEDVAPEAPLRLFARAKRMAGDDGDGEGPRPRPAKAPRRSGRAIRRRGAREEGDPEEGQWAGAGGPSVHAVQSPGGPISALVPVRCDFRNYPVPIRAAQQPQPLAPAPAARQLWPALALWPMEGEGAVPMPAPWPDLAPGDLSVPPSMPLPTFPLALPLDAFVPQGRRLPALDLLASPPLSPQAGPGPDPDPRPYFKGDPTLAQIPALLARSADQRRREALVDAETLVSGIEGLRICGPDDPEPDREIHKADVLAIPLSSSSASVRSGAAALGLRVHRGYPPSALRLPPGDVGVAEAAYQSVLRLVERGPAADDAAWWRQLVDLLTDPRLLDSRLFSTQAGPRPDARPARGEGRQEGRLLVLRGAYGVQRATCSYAVAACIPWILSDALCSAATQGISFEEARLLCDHCWNLASTFLDCNMITSPDLSLLGAEDAAVMLDRAAGLARRFAAQSPELLARALWWRAFAFRQAGCEPEAEACLEEALKLLEGLGAQPSRLEAALLRDLYDTAWTLKRPPALLQRLRDRLYWFCETDEDKLREAMAQLTLIKCATAEQRGPSLLRIAERAVELVEGLPPAYQNRYLLNVRYNLFTMQLLMQRHEEAIATYERWVAFCVQCPTRLAGPNADFAMIMRALLPARTYRVSDFLRFARAMIAVHRAADPEGRTPVMGHLLYLYGDVLLYDGQTIAAAACLAQSLEAYSRLRELFPPDSPRIAAVRRSFAAAVAPHPS